ncbi:hypothetical protein CRUP_037643 [Coryphaenoides rupestris]|nr:hypothetical protein CRUP_037643 [Coryphaenoides rupestris]
MSDMLEKTTDGGPLLSEGRLGVEGAGPQGETREDPGGGGPMGELSWEDGGLPGELQRGMENLRSSGELTDVTLRVQGGLDGDTMRSLLDYTYTSHAVITNANVQKLLEAASQFQVILQDEFPSLPAEALESALSRDDLSVTCEECVFEALMRWVRAERSERAPLLAAMLRHVRLPLLEPAYFVETVEADELIRGCAEAFPVMQEARSYHLLGREVVSERTKPRMRHFLSEVFMIIGGCTRDERFISTVTCLDPLRRSRLEVASLPLTNMQEEESQNRKWVEFACVTFRKEVYISALDRWIRTEPMATGRWRHKMAVHGGKLYVLGGFDGIQRLASLGPVDLRDGRRAGREAGHGRGAVLGAGERPLGPPRPHARGAMHAMYSYSPASDAWSMVCRLGDRASCAIAACNDKLFVTGGRDDSNRTISSVVCWDAGTQTLTEECVLPLGVSHHGSVTLMKSYTHIHRISPATTSPSAADAAVVSTSSEKTEVKD